MIVDQERAGNVTMKTSANEAVTKKLLPIGSVLVAVDLSARSEATAFYAAKIAQSFDARLTIAHVCEPVPVCEYASETTLTVLEEEREALEELLTQLARKIQKTGVICSPVFLMGAPAEQISALARDIDADLIVTASHHPTFLGRLFHLDKATLILHRAPCPVLICPDESAPGEHSADRNCGRMGGESAQGVGVNWA
jgi:nucleotide-binding universal stress UspA family protein